MRYAFELFSYLQIFLFPTENCKINFQKLIPYRFRIFLFVRIQQQTYAMLLKVITIFSAFHYRNDSKQ